MTTWSELRSAEDARLSGLSKGARTRLRILDAGARVLRRNGYSETRLADIAEVAGLQTGSLAFHFPSKDELLREVLRHGMAVGLAQCRAAVDALGPGAGPERRIVAAMHAHLDGMDDRNDYAPAVLRSFAQFPARERQRFRDLDTAYLDFWRELLVDAQRSGLIATDLDAALLVRLLLGAMNATLGLPDLAPRQRLVATLTSMLGLPPISADGNQGGP